MEIADGFGNYLNYRDGDEDRHIYRIISTLRF